MPLTATENSSGNLGGGEEELLCHLLPLQPSCVERKKFDCCAGYIVVFPLQKESHSRSVCLADTVAMSAA